MDTQPAYEAVADAFVAEGTRTAFCLLGDGNMHWGAAIAGGNRVRLVHVRHEHCAVSAASAHARATGEVGVASVTCGPGFTQTMTALTTATRARIPLVVLAGEAPIGARWHNQAIDQQPFAEATGAGYVAARAPARMLQDVRTAFYRARTERRPIVLGIPYDLQQHKITVNGYAPSSEIVPPRSPLQPDQDDIARAADAIAAAERPIILAGRGVRSAGAVDEVRALADAAGALLSTTLPVKGLYDDHPYSLGIAGGFSLALAHRLLAECDAVVAIGASLSNHTADAGRLFSKARVIHVDENPHGINQGLKTGDLHVRGDARLAAIALREAVGARGSRSTLRTPEIAKGIAEDGPEPPVHPVEPGLLHPAAAVTALNDALPKDWHLVSGSGHCSFYITLMRDRPTEKFHTIREFGAIGNGLSYAIGVAAAHPGEQIVLVEGDGGFLMHAQELETIRRHGLNVLVCVLNDGAYGSEIHKLRADGLDDSEVVFGRGDLGAMGRGFGLGGATVTDAAQIPGLAEAFRQQGGGAAVWDIHISDQVASPTMLRGHGAPHHKPAK